MDARACCITLVNFFVALLLCAELLFIPIYLLTDLDYIPLELIGIAAAHVLALLHQVFHKVPLGLEYAPVNLDKDSQHLVDYSLVPAWKEAEAKGDCHLVVIWLFLNIVVLVAPFLVCLSGTKLFS